MGNCESVEKEKSTTTILQKDLQTTFFPEVHRRLGECQTGFVCDANENRQNLPK